MKLFLLSLFSFFCLVINNLRAQELPNNPWHTSQQTFSQPTTVTENPPSSLKANPWQNTHTSVHINADTFTSELTETNKEKNSVSTNQRPIRKFGGLGHISNISPKEISQPETTKSGNNELSDLMSNLKLVGYDIPDVPLTEKSSSSGNPLDTLSVSDIFDYKSLGQKGYQTIQNSASPFINYMRGMVHSFERGSGINLDKIINNTF